MALLAIAALLTFLVIPLFHSIKSKVAKSADAEKGPWPGL